MVALFGVVTQPSTRARVSWQAIPAIKKDLEYAARLNIPSYGIIGNTAHLRGSGQHTPWSTGWEFGFVHAVDFGINKVQFDIILRDLQTGRWNGIVRFVNFGGKIYHRRNDWLPRPNADKHLHISYEQGSHRYQGPSLLEGALGGIGKPKEKEEYTMAEISQGVRETRIGNLEKIPGLASHETESLKREHGVRVADILAFLVHELSSLSDKVDRLAARQ